ncbi:hypothetical protein EV175_002655 [Coemansia sp. RSA 1933]|nr:hypothetical protein EV175_002655 [Coemansia sp. RSA 1933]
MALPAEDITTKGGDPSKCNGNTAMCPNNDDGVYSTYMQCNSWSHTYETINCPTGQVCFADPTSPGAIICAAPGSGGVPSAGICSGNEAKCAAPGNSGNYYSCQSSSHHYVNDQCPSGLTCYDNGDTVICK